MNSNVLKNILAILVMAGIAAGAGLTFWVSSKEVELSIPTAIAALKDNRVVVATLNDLLVSDNLGRLEKTVPLSELGIHETVSDLQPLPDDSILLSESRNGLVYRCSLESEQCTIFIRTQGVSIDPQVNSAKLAFNWNNQTLYLSNSWLDRIEKYDLKGSFLGLLRLDDKGLAYPNDLWVTDDGAVVVTDTNHRRVITLSPEATEGQEESARSEGFATSSCCSYPLAVSFASGRWWLVEGSEALLSTYLTAYDASGEQLFRVTFGQGSDPAAVEPFGSGLLLVAVQSSARIAIVGPDGEDAGAFESSGLYEYFENVRAAQHSLKRVNSIAWIILVLSGLLAIAVVYLEYSRKRAADSGDEPGRMRENILPVSGETRWFSASKKMRTSLFVLYALMAVLFGDIIGRHFGDLEVISDHLKLGDVPYQLKLLSMLVFSSLFTVWMSWSMWKVLGSARIGVAGDKVWLDDGFGRRKGGEPGRLFYSDMLLVYEDVAVYYRLGTFNLFDKQAVNNLISRMDKSQRLSRRETGKLLRKIKHPMILLAYKALLIMTVWMGVLYYLRDV